MALWIYPTSQSAQASDSSTSPSPEFFQALAQSLWWRGKPSQSRTWSTRWKRERYIRHLSARTCGSYAQAIFLMSSSSSGASPASRTATPVSSSAKTTSGISSTSSCDSFASWSPASSSWKTSQGLFTKVDSEDYSGRWPNSGSMRNGELYERQTLEHPTAEGGSSSWPTATSGDSKSSGEAGYSTEGGRHTGTTLTDASRQWATPTARDWKDGKCAEANVPVNALLGRQVLKATGQGSLKDCGRLNPTFVEWLMGAPIGWTAFEHWGTL